jgi:hypothetical protein
LILAMDKGRKLSVSAHFILRKCFFTLFNLWLYRCAIPLVSVKVLS